MSKFVNLSNYISDQKILVSQATDFFLATGLQFSEKQWHLQDLTLLSK